MRESLRVTSGPSLREQVAAKLRNAIAMGQFRPGERLVERELCEMTGVSRTSVREALRELESDGLITTVPHRGPSVAMVTLEQAQSIYEVRAVLEALAARLFALNASDEDVEALVEATDALRQAYANGRLAEIFPAKTRFYEILLDGSRNEVVSHMLKSIHIRVSQLRMTSLSQPERTKSSITEIRALVDAIRARNADEAARLCLVHVNNAAKVALQIIGDGQESGSKAATTEANGAAIAAVLP